MVPIRSMIFPAVLVGSFFVCIVTNLVGTAPVANAYADGSAQAQISATGSNSTQFNINLRSEPAAADYGGSPSKAGSEQQPASPAKAGSNAAPAKPSPTPTKKTAAAAAANPTSAPAAAPKPTQAAAAKVEEKPAVVAKAVEALNNKSDAKCRVSPKYPQSVRQWCVLVEKYASQNGVDPDLITALIWQESGGNAKAYSKSGAVGLMQVMPRDGLAAAFQCSGKPCFSSRPTMAELYDPEFNISYGTRFLAGLFQRLGTWRVALKSYGPADYGYIYADKVLGIFNQYKD